MNRRAFFAAVPAALVGAKAVLEAKPATARYRVHPGTMHHSAPDASQVDARWYPVNGQNFFLEATEFYVQWNP